MYFLKVEKYYSVWLTGLSHVCSWFDSNVSRTVHFIKKEQSDVVSDELKTPDTELNELNSQVNRESIKLHIEKYY